MGKENLTTALGSDDKKTQREAQKRFDATKNNDPFPEIPPALLNSADIHDYIENTGMICPYDPNKLKSSSYEVQIGGKAILWDEHGKKDEIDLENGQEVTVKPNSLVFFQTKQKFRLPDYIAIRFNLRITNVHRGLLLGTGPIVDPGFEGHLLIPLHNLTSNSYIFRGGDKFIWVEFTKISPNKIWENSKVKEKRKGEYVPFPNTKKNLSYQYYLKEADEHRPIMNALPEFLEETRTSAFNAKEFAERANKRTDNFSLLGLLTALGLGMATIANYNDFSGLAADSTRNMSEMEAKIQGHLSSVHNRSDELVALQEQLTNNNEKLEESITQDDVLAENVQSLEDQITQLEKQIAQLLENQASKKE